MSEHQNRLIEDIQLLEDALIKSQSRARTTELKMTQMEMEYKQLIVQFQKYKEKVFLLLHAIETSQSFDSDEKDDTIQALQDQLNLHSVEILKTKERILARSIFSEYSQGSNRRISTGLMYFFDKFEEVIMTLFSLLCRAIRTTAEKLLIFFSLERAEETMGDNNFDPMSKNF